MRRSMILGAAGFIGTNLAIKLAKLEQENIILVDQNIDYFDHIKKMNLPNVEMKEVSFSQGFDFDNLLEGVDVLYHLVSTSIPATSNQHIPQEIMDNVVFSALLFDACVRQNVKEIVFISSGGTVYGKANIWPIKEDFPTFPISSYGLQKITIEKLLHVYYYMYDLDYRIIRLANPYGPYQRPNSGLGVVTTFTYKALKDEKVIVYGDGTVIRDFVYIEDAIDAIIKIVDIKKEYKIYNVGSGKGTSIIELINIIEKILGVKMKIGYEKERKVDVPVNILDVSRYEKQFGEIVHTSFEEGIMKTADYLKETVLREYL